MSADQYETKVESKTSANAEDAGLAMGEPTEDGTAAASKQTGTAPETAVANRLAAKALELLEELTEDNVSMTAMLNRVLEGQAAARSELAREIDTVRQDLAGGAAYRALKDLCTELSMPLSALQAMLRHGNFSDPDVVRDHVSALARTIESVLARMGAEQIRVDVGEELFNPERHFCMGLVAPEKSPFPSAPARTVVRVFENGYSLVGRMLSPARVEVQAESEARPTEVGR